MSVKNRPQKTEFTKCELCQCTFSTHHANKHSDVCNTSLGFQIPNFDNITHLAPIHGFIHGDKLIAEVSVCRGEVSVR